MYSSHNLHAVIRSVSADGASSHALPSYQSSWSQGSPPGSPPTSRTPNSSAVAESRKRERVEDTEEPESRKRTRLEDTEEPDRQRYNNSTALPFLRWGRHFPDVPIPHLLESASPKPPITVANLSELDISNIIPNQMLRHNLNFETHARFRPNYNTQLGRMRKAEARKYWAALEIEITYYMRDGHVRSQISSMIGSTIPERLPKMLAEMKCILITLLQKEQAVVVEQTLDVNLIMQQLQKNACDLVKLGDWLATMLQSSCSPQRDNDVVSATDTLKMAAENADPSLTVDGLEHLFSVFETMKLVSPLDCGADISSDVSRMLRTIKSSPCALFSSKMALSLSRTASPVDQCEARKLLKLVPGSRSAAAAHRQGMMTSRPVLVVPSIVDNTWWAMLLLNP